MKKVYFNQAQRIVQLIGAKVSVIVAGRRTGKTHGIAAPFVLRNIQRMPRSTGGIVVPTYKHGLTNTIPGLLAALRTYGYERDVHYVVGKRPPKDWPKPIIEPASYERVIAFYNGSVAVLISQDRPGSSNSLTLSWLLIDEAKFIDFAKLKDETFPANGGSKVDFGMHSCNHSIMILSDMPVGQKGSWFLAYKSKMNKEVIRAIEGRVYSIWKLKERMRRTGKASKRDVQRLRRMDRELNQLRSVAVYYKEYSSIENVALLGVEYIRQMKRDLPPKIFQTSILCRPITISKDGFYSSMTEACQYTASNIKYLESVGLDAEAMTLDCRADGDLVPGEPICIGMDYGANINWLVAAQPLREFRRLNVLKSFFVKYERKIPELIDDFCEYYLPHPTKIVVLYYDSTALNGNYAINDEDFLYVIRRRFEMHGWTVVTEYLGAPMKHKDKYLFMAEGFSGHKQLRPYFNEPNNEALLVSIKSAGVYKGINGLHKDKSGEKKPETDENQLENRTDGSDAFDTVYIGCETRPCIGYAGEDYTGVG